MHETVQNIWFFRWKITLKSSRLKSSKNWYPLHTCLSKILGVSQCRSSWYVVLFKKYLKIFRIRKYFNLHENSLVKTSSLRKIRFAIDSYFTFSYNSMKLNLNKGVLVLSHVQCDLTEETSFCELNWSEIWTLFCK